MRLYTTKLDFSFQAFANYISFCVVCSYTCGMEHEYNNLNITLYMNQRVPLSTILSKVKYS